MNFDELNVPFRDFVDVFERLKIPYALIGGLAVGVHGIPRPTHDLDFTIAVERSRLSEFFQAIIELGYDVPHEFTTGWVDEVAGMPLVKARQWVEGKTIDVDVFLAESPFGAAGSGCAAGCSGPKKSCSCVATAIFFA